MKEERPSDKTTYITGINPLPLCIFEYVFGAGGIFISQL
jgi:hypothetical protein